ncbi:hypothetical protein TURU_093423 [Turdus rufiventris]|nr:hypothetical protein TURU_093423 [Turdus rufiventris]
MNVHGDAEIHLQPMESHRDAQIHLQPMENHRDAQTHLQPMENHRDAEINPQPMEETHARAGGCLGVACDAVGGLWVEEPTLEQPVLKELHPGAE